MKKPILPILLILFIGISSCATPPEKPAAAAPDAELAEAKALKQRADLYGLKEYAAEKYASGEKNLQAGEDAYGKDNAAAKQSLDLAIADYKEVIDAGSALFLGKRRERTDAYKKAADDLKSSVAVKDTYAKAMEAYDKATAAAAAKDMENASKNFEQADVLFQQAATEAQAKKDAAVKAMAEADKSFAESQAQAEEAEKALQEEGFETSGQDQ